MSTDDTTSFSTEDSNDIISSIIIGSIVTLVSFVVFIVIRKIDKSFYQVKLQDSNNSNPISFFLDWIVTIYKFEEQEILDSRGGLDAVLYLRYAKYATYLFASIGVLSICVLIPTNYASKDLMNIYYSKYNNLTLYNATSQVLSNLTLPNRLDELTMTNIPRGSKILYVHLVSVYVFSFMAWFFLYQIFSSYIYLQNAQKQKDSYITRTILVLNVPSRYGTDRLFNKFFLKYYRRRSISRAYIIKKNIGTLYSAIKHRQELETQYQVAIDYEKEKNGKQLKVRKIEGKLNFLEGIPIIGNLRFLPGEELDAERYYREKIIKQDAKIEKIKKETVMKDSKIGIVTFTSSAETMKSLQTLHCEDPSKFEMRQGTDPEEIWWEFLTKNEHERNVRRVFIWGALFVLFVFWSIPVIFISGVSNLEQLGSIKFLKPIVEKIEENKRFATFLDGFLPSLALNLFMALLPEILGLIVGWRGWRLRTEYLQEIARAYFAFLVLNVFFVTTIAGSLFTVFGQIVDQPDTVIELLANSLPNQAYFFVNYITLQAAVDFPVFGFVRITHFLICKLKHIVWAKTKRQVIKANIFKQFEYHERYPEDMLVFIIALTYCTMAPLIMIFAAVYFFLAYWTAKYNFIYVFEPELEGVKMTHSLIDFILGGILIYQLTMIGLFTISGFNPGAIASIVVVVLTLLFRVWLHRRFTKPSRYLPLENCPRLIRDERQRVKSDANRLEFIHPALRPLKTFEEMEEDSNRDPYLDKAIIRTASFTESGMWDKASQMRDKDLEDSQVQIVPVDLTRRSIDYNSSMALSNSYNNDEYDDESDELPESVSKPMTVLGGVTQVLGGVTQVSNTVIGGVTSASKTVSKRVTKNLSSVQKTLSPVLTKRLTKNNPNSKPSATSTSTPRSSSRSSSRSNSRSGSRSRSASMSSASDASDESDSGSTSANEKRVPVSDKTKSTELP